MKTSQSNQESVLDAAELEQLTTIEITHGTNGYPKRLGEKGVIGFDNYKQARTFANEHGCDIVCFKKRDGWHFWENLGTRYEALTASDYVNDLGDNYMTESFDAGYFHDELSTLSSDSYPDFEDIENFIKNQKELYEATQNLESDEEIITTGGSVYEIVKREMMAYNEDVWHYAVGVIVYPSDDEDEDE